MKKGLSDDVDVPELVSKAFKNLFISYSKSINEKYKRTGSLFQYKFKRKEITNEEYLAKLIQYIHYNPVKAGLCGNYLDWEFSSYNAILSDRGTCVSRDGVLELFGGRDGFKSYHEDYQFDYEDVRECFEG